MISDRQAGKGCRWGDTWEGSDVSGHAEKKQFNSESDNFSQGKKTIPSSLESCRSTGGRITSVRVHAASAC